MAIIDGGSSGGAGGNESLQRIKIGVGFGLGRTGLIILLGYAIYLYNKRNPPPTQPSVPSSGTTLNPIRNPVLPMSARYWLYALVILGQWIVNSLAGGPERDGIVQGITAYDGMIYQAIRWEPICGTVVLFPSYPDLTQNCAGAVSAYRNITEPIIAYYDISGVRLLQAGIGLGKALCACFAMSDSLGKATDICWYFNEIGQWAPYYSLGPSGSYRPGASKSFPKCGDVDVPALQAQWSRTAIMPTAIGPVQTLQLGPSTVIQTVVRTQTYVLTPTLLPFTVTSASVITGSNGQVTTQDLSYVTTAVVVNAESSGSSGGNGNDNLQRVKIGVGLGLGLPTLGALLAYAMYLYNKRNSPPPPPPPPPLPTSGPAGGGAAPNPTTNPFAGQIGDGRPLRY
ncbi:hypothetical protein FRC17_008906 [Serendipita sp. 399]|nr:hypothetical protein FRC17_008906 [Serendipita sp. 399]